MPKGRYIPHAIFDSRLIPSLRISGKKKSSITYFSLVEPFYSVRTMPKHSGLWLATEAPRFAVKQSIDNKKMKIIRYSRLLEETWSLITPLLPLPQLLDESACITEVFFFSLSIFSLLVVCKESITSVPGRAE